jgi:hypothetical protein
LWGMSRDYYGQFLLSQGRYNEAMGQFQVILSYQRSTIDLQLTNILYFM